MAKDKLASDCIDRWKELDEQFYYWKLKFRDIRDYVLPHRGKFLDEKDSFEGGENRHDKIIDGEATQAIRLLSAGMHGGLTSPARPWFKTSPGNIGLLRSRAVKEWLEYVDRVLYGVLARSNFYSTIHAVYEEEAGFGTGALNCEADFERIVRFNVMTAGEYRCATNSGGLVDTIYRLFGMTAKQMAERFGEDNLSDAVKRELKNGRKYEWHKILHVVEPRKDRDVYKIDNKNMAFKEIYIDHDSEEVMQESGYNEFPVAVARWTTVGNEPYGISPGHHMLGHVKQLQVETIDKLKALQKTVSPPMRVPTAYKDVLNTLPDGVNWVDSASNDAIAPLYQINFNIQGVMEDIARLKNEIRRGFYNDLFMMLVDNISLQPKTATEIAALQEEKLIMLGPVIERQFHELLDPALNRTFMEAFRRGIIPPPPRELQGQELKVEYISMLAEAQKRIGVSSISNTVAFITQLGTILPAALDTINVDGAVDYYADLFGAPVILLNDQKVRDQARAARAQAAQQAQQMQQMEIMATGAKSVKELAKAPMDGNNALAAISGAMGGQMSGGANASA